MSRYTCVADQKAAGFPVTQACKIAEVSTSGFYDWSARAAAEPTEREVVEAELVVLIREIFAATEGNYGVPRMHRELRDKGIVVNIKRVRRLMRLHGMAGRCVRRRVRTTVAGPDGYTIPDLVGRALTPGAPDRSWCQDITYIPTGEGWLYLASVIDIGSRRMLGYSMADHMRTELVIDALDMAIAARADHVAGVIAHADRGSQYTSNHRLCIETRSTAEVNQDLRSIRNWYRDHRLRCPAIEFADKSEPLTWLADAASGIWADALIGRDRHLPELIASGCVAHASTELP